MDLDEKLSKMMNKTKIEDAMKIDPDQDLSVDKEVAAVKIEEPVKEPVSEAMSVLAEFFKIETKNGAFYDHDEKKHRKKVQKFLIDNGMLEQHECARR